MIAEGNLLTSIKTSNGSSMEVVAVKHDSFLMRNEGESLSQLEQEILHVVEGDFFPR